MYKVFINDRSIIFTNDITFKENTNCVRFKKKNFKEKLAAFIGSEQSVIVFLCKDSDKSWNLFKKSFTRITAAGGLVFNKKKELLVIFRNGMWDLPKGKVEKGEEIKVAAVREVEEETGIVVKKRKKLKWVTYHMYFWKDELVLKDTYWYPMTSSFKGALLPQIEEGITKVAWIPENKIKKVYKNTFGNIKGLLDTLEWEKKAEK